MGWGLAQHLAQDVRFALRTFRANPNLTLTVVISLALGIGGTCAMFSVIYGILIDPYIYKDAGRIIVPTYSEPDSDNRRPTLYYTPADFIEMQANSRAFQSITLTNYDAAVSDGATPVNINVLDTSANCFADVPKPERPACAHISS